MERANYAVKPWHSPSLDNCAAGKPLHSWTRYRRTALSRHVAQLKKCLFVDPNTHLLPLQGSQLPSLFLTPACAVLYQQTAAGRPIRQCQACFDFHKYFLFTSHHSLWSAMRNTTSISKTWKVVRQQILPWV